MDYENFATGLTVDHDDIKQNAALCGIDDGVWKCPLIQQENTKNGMIIPEDECRVDYAAYYGDSISRFQDDHWIFPGFNRMRQNLVHPYHFGPIFQLVFLFSIY